jgi:hypothetical protein
MPRAAASRKGSRQGDPIAIRSTFQVLRAAVAGAVASDRGGLHASADLGGGDLSLPRSATALAGLEAHAQPEAAAWLSGMMQWVTGAPPGPLPEPQVELPLRAWALLHEGGPMGFDTMHLAQAVPRGEAWVVALAPERFVGQALARLSQESTTHATRMRARLERPSANLSTVQRLIETAALSLDPGGLQESPALRLRLGSRTPQPLSRPPWCSRPGGPGARGGAIRRRQLLPGRRCNAAPRGWSSPSPERSPSCSRCFLRRAEARGRGTHPQGPAAWLALAAQRSSPGSSSVCTPSTGVR